MTVGATNGAFEVAFNVTPTATGALTNPAGGGLCRVDPNGAVAEGNEGNNDCAPNTVTVNPYRLHLPLVIRQGVGQLNELSYTLGRSAWADPIIFSPYPL
ncbi:MAG TPA: hypothetical protein VNK89_02520 [Thermoflexus sp.]|nr:hypothetical protein [Thermoflexus sp.]